jgi:hypothetical protein
MIRYLIPDGLTLLTCMAHGVIRSHGNPGQI